MKKTLREFKDFLIRGNVVDLAVAVIIAGAFGKIVASLVADIIMPLIAALIGVPSFTDLAWSVVRGSETILIPYGNFIQTIVDFVIIGLVLFLLVKLITATRKKVEEVPAGPSASEVLLTEIRDLLKDQNK
ncbi:MAG: large-conductance mechanosensitive channel protein MscL [Erysipelotrichaceae bacterium]